MSNVDIVAHRVESLYRISFSMGRFTLSLKLDTGAKYTVISAGMLDDTLTEDKLEKIKSFCEKNSIRKEQFISAGGGTFFGYLVNAHNAKMDSVILNDFYFYLVIENKRDIALLGFDFIEHCGGTINIHDNIIINEFDDSSYAVANKAIECDALISLIYSLSEYN